ncbi:MAG: alpha-galactosidase [Verrucomicrobia bacterium]|nr:alpha-galactosidase [Verrucomicrobiota bacterium]
MNSYPIPFLFGKAASQFGARPIPGLTLIDGTHELSYQMIHFGGDGQWRFREVGGAMELTIRVERLEAHGAAKFRATVCNTDDRARIFDFFQTRLDFDLGDERWRVKVAGGGQAIGTYPTPAYDIREYNFLGEGCLVIGTDPNGRSSDKDLPLMIVTRGAGENARGFWWGMEWSGEWFMTASVQQKDRLFRVDAGLPVQRLRIEPGEELTFPTVHVGVFQGDMADGANALRRYIYQHLQPEYLGERPYPRVSYDHWFGLHNAVNCGVLKPQIDRAAEIGIEMWVFDAGWFGEFPREVGNWNATDPKKFPNGLESLADDVHARGMQMGLWFECEHAFPDTWAVKEYPELFWPSPIGDHQYHLNLARRDAQDWLIELISNWIKRLGLRWSRWDYNVNPGPYWRAQDLTGKIQLGYVQGLYRVLDELRRRHPEWMIENCASGGRRIDLGTIARSHTHWFSDYTHGPYTCRWMQLRAQQFLPGNCPNSSFAVPKGAGDPSNIDHEVLSRATGKLSFDGDIASLSRQATQRCRHWVLAYKKFRHLLVQDFWQRSPIPRTTDDWDVVQFSAYDGSEGLLAAYRIEGHPSWRGALARSAPSGCYQFTDLASGESRALSGTQLQETGIELSLAPHSARLMRWKKMET